MFHRLVRERKQGLRKWGFGARITHVILRTGKALKVGQNLESRLEKIKKQDFGSW